MRNLRGNFGIQRQVTYFYTTFLTRKRGGEHRPLPRRSLPLFTHIYLSTRKIYSGNTGVLLYDQTFHHSPLVRSQVIVIITSLLAQHQQHLENVTRIRSELSELYFIYLFIDRHTHGHLSAEGIKMCSHMT